MRLGLRALFDLETEMEVVAETRDGNEALMLIERLLPDVAILDTCLPGTEVAQIVKVIGQRQYPTQVLALSPGLHEDDQLQKAILAGAKGCLLKSNARRNAVRAVEMVANGDAWFSYEIIREMAAACEGEAQPPVQRPKLTPREREVLGLLRRGWTNRHIAYDLGIKERTIRFHLGNIYRKLEVSSRAEASVWAVENGIGEPEDRK
jgi:DNA-binding NarL/FixJ family response regulator